MYNTENFNDILITLYRINNVSKINALKITPVIMRECLVMDSSDCRGLFPSRNVQSARSNCVAESYTECYAGDKNC
ncbi:hypothetical protein POVWA2_064800 [Plasmodium ovale wallikeri]|uniref:Uncharacterized protein n=1 Tax=Plasmodium ovale wallikeri TaxID=864142 RepID=A0A1A9ABN3_PLAOA|nr:hypothetical protein POVWA2_064800 [Plasmodium ovale wallikeri]SBT55721.1 hypothetical protein POVWA1_071770 [Plasmodium ovale wallikeri]